MCLIAFAINASERWPLVIASNRDEFVARPTVPLARWASPAGQPIISGRDLQAGGTWLGLTPGGRVAFLTNVREARPPVAARSRGELVTRWLEDGGDAARFVAALEAGGDAYAGFNLVLGDFQRQAWTWVTNRHGAGSRWHAEALAAGIYGLSNAQLDTPWPKTTQLKRVLTQALATPDELQSQLWTALADPRRAAAGQVPVTGVAPAFEAALSSAFVEFPEHGYGTRSSTLLLASPQTAPGGASGWEVQVDEKTYRRDRAPVLQPPLMAHCRVSWPHTGRD